MTMSTYKSLAGPAGGLIVTNDAELAQRLEGIAYPGLPANFDAGNTAAPAVTMLDRTAAGAAYAAMMVETAAVLAAELGAFGVPEVARLAMTGQDMPEVASMITRALGGDPESMADDVTVWRARFSGHLTAQTT